MSDPTANQPDFSVDNSAAQAQAMLGQAATEPVSEPTTPTGDGQPTDQQPTEAELSEFAAALLEELPEEHRDTFRPYVDKWDAGMTRRVNQLYDYYSPINQVLDQGFDVTELATAAQFYDLMTTNPAAAREIWDKIAPAQQEALAQGVQQQGAAPQGQPQGQPQIALPPELQQRLDTVTQFMEQSALRDQERRQAEAVAAEDQALEEFFQTLHREMGDFDDDYVAYRMYVGDTPEDAIASFRKLTGNSNGAPAATPNGQTSALPPVPVLHGGSAGGGPKPITQASDAEVRALVEKMVTDANAQAS